MERAGNKLLTFFELIKFEHTVFALPFAYLGMLLAARGWPRADQFLWITLAMVSARTVGMTLNRILDVRIDEKNPRTSSRALVTGEFPLAGAWGVTASATAIFFISAWRLNPLCFRLSFVALFLLSTYHFVKRFSFLCHFTLGLVLAIAPIGGWMAVTGHFAWQPVFLSLAVLFWVAGFDILYSLQDFDFDRTHNIHSIPAKFGQTAALKIAALCHAATVLFLLVFGVARGLGWIYWLGVAVTGGLLKAEHMLLNENDLSRIHTAFFTINSWIGVFLLVFTFLEIFR